LLKSLIMNIRWINVHNFLYLNEFYEKDNFSILVLFLVIVGKEYQSINIKVPLKNLIIKKFKNLSFY
jgi:hypothetical protein